MSHHEEPVCVTEIMTRRPLAPNRDDEIRARCERFRFWVMIRHGFLQPEVFLGSVPAAWIAYPGA